MTPRSFAVPLHPEVLSWARGSLGISPDAAAAAAGVSVDEYMDWETGGSLPRMTQVRKLAPALQCTVATLLLPEPAPSPRHPRDYRTLPTKSEHPLSTPTLLAIRRARQVADLAIELQAWMGLESQFSLPSISRNQDPESAAEALRASIGLTLSSQTACATKHKAYQLWRLRVEDRGVYVLEGNFPSAECRGFSIFDPAAPVIAVTNQDFAAPRAFSLLHELTHLALRVSGLCEVDAPWPSTPAKVEVFCNRVAGAVLVPSDSLLGLDPVLGNYGPEWSDDLLEGIARVYHVSKEVILRRLLILGRTDSATYELKRAEWASAHEDMSTFIPRVTQSRRAFNRNGVRFSELVVSATHAGILTSFEAAEFLSTKPKHLASIEQMAAERRSAR